jgi:hypothetical protein
VEGVPPSIASSEKGEAIVFGAENYTDEELIAIILERLPECKRVQLEWIAALASIQMPTGGGLEQLAKVYPFPRATCR